jgi:hypothetical protein
MDNKHIKNTTFGESCLGYGSATSVSMANDGAQNSYPQKRLDMTETDANSLAKPDRRDKVYLHSIGRFRNLKKLQSGAYDD